MTEDPKRLSGEDDRRSFLQSCGRFAVTVPPAITVLLSTSLSSGAIAKSAGGGGGGPKKSDGSPPKGPDQAKTTNVPDRAKITNVPDKAQTRPGSPYDRNGPPGN